MKKEIISTIKEKPKTKTGWWAFGLSMGAIASGPILGAMAAFVVPFLGNNLSESVGQIAGFSAMILMVSVLIATLVLSIKAYLSGEQFRS